MIDCQYYQQNECRSCQWLEIPYDQQIAEKQHHLKQQLISLDCSDVHWLAPFKSNEQGFRNKAKMLVSGSVERPILGILKNPNDPQSAIDLCDCPLYPAHFSIIFQSSKILLVAQV